jgi:hypothetical protein
VTFPLGIFNEIYTHALAGNFTEKCAFLVHSVQHAQYNNSYGGSLAIMDNERLSKMAAYTMSRNSMMLEQLNQIVGRFIPSGIIKHLCDFGLWFFVKPLIEDVVDSRRILSLSDLEFGFVIWLAACLMSFCVFVCEVLSEKLKTGVRTLMGLVQFVRLLRARMVRYHDTW